MPDARRARPKTDCLTFRQPISMAAASDLLHNSATPGNFLLIAEMISSACEASTSGNTSGSPVAVTA